LSASDDWQGIRRAAERWPDDSPPPVCDGWAIGIDLQFNIRFEQAIHTSARFGCYLNAASEHETSLNGARLPFLNRIGCCAQQFGLIFKRDPHCLQ